MEVGSGRDRDAAANKQQRAGKHVQQPAGYQAFIPAPLPPEPDSEAWQSGSLEE